VTRNFGEKRLIGAVILDVAKAFDTVGVDGLLYKLTLLNFLSILNNPPDVRSVLPNSQIYPSWHEGWRGTGWTSFPCAAQSVYQ
jgi:hypothetical protein